MSKRKAISKTVRFEVFKRDRFTCQYCGEKAPDVVLHVDHILAVANGGTNDILNLVTSCAGCNGGKGARRLDDRSAVERQRVMIEEAAERREQIQMMLQWRDQEEAARVSVLNEIAVRMHSRGGFYPNDNGRTDVRRWLKRFELSEILKALDDSFDAYMKWDGDEPIPAAWNMAFAKIPAFISMNRQAADKPYIAKLAYIQGIIRNRLNDRYGKYLEDLELFHLRARIPLDVMERAAKQANDWLHFADLLVEWRDEQNAREADDEEG